MGIFDKLTKIAEKATDAMVKTSDRINQTYQKEGFDGIINKTADSLTKAGQKTQGYLDNIGEKNKHILDSIPDKDFEGTLAKATAVVINTTQTLVKDAAKVTMKTVDSVSKNIEKMVKELETNDVTEPTKPVVKKTTSDIKELFLNEAQIAELDCMPIILVVKHLCAENNIDGDSNKYKIENVTFNVNKQLWYDLNNSKSGQGSLSFVNHFIRVKNKLGDFNNNPELDKEIRNSTFDILSKVFELKEYQQDLSSWIQDENFKIKKVTPAVEETPKVKRVRKTVIKAEHADESNTPKIVAKKTVKKPIVVKVVEKDVSKTTVKLTKKPNLK